MVEKMTENKKLCVEGKDCFYNTLDGELYYEGDVVPAYNYGGGTAFNGEVIKVLKPGFAGLVKIKKELTGGKVVIIEYDIRMSESDIDEWVVKPIMPDDNSYIIAPEPVAWRWSYAMEEIMKSHMIKRGHAMIDDNGDSYRLEE